MKLKIIDEKSGISYLPHMFVDRLYQKFGKKVIFINDTQRSMGSLKEEKQ